MKILFIHQNFPAQFRHLAPALAKDKANTVLALTMREAKPLVWRGIQILPYRPNRNSSKDIHPWVGDLEAKVIRGEACWQACLELGKRGFKPDLVIAHPGWGEALFVKEVWPETKLALYCEFYYQPGGADVGFDPEFSAENPGDRPRLRMKNAATDLLLQVADAAISPTQWQKSTYPAPWQKRITAIHDGIDTDLVCPNAKAFINMKTKAGDELKLTVKDEIITYVVRNLEPYRGYHTFMRALPDLLRLRPNARVVIVGGSDVSYGSAPPKGKTWRDVFTEEVRPKITDEDWPRVHFVGRLPYSSYLSLLQVSTVHVYLTYPFVLSWSLLEAMSAGCAIVASDTAPVREVIKDGRTGLLVDFFKPQELAQTVHKLLESKTLRQKLSKSARKFMVEGYDLKGICMPKQLEWVDNVKGD